MPPSNETTEQRSRDRVLHAGKRVQRDDLGTTKQQYEPAGVPGRGPDMLGTHSAASPLAGSGYRTKILWTFNLLEWCELQSMAAHFMSTVHLQRQQMLCRARHSMQNVWFKT